MSENKRWSGPGQVKYIVLEAALGVTNCDKKVTFTLKQLEEKVLEKHPTFNKHTVGYQLRAGCPNHKHYYRHPKVNRFYWEVDKGVYRLYDPAKDKDKHF